MTYMPMQSHDLKLELVLKQLKIENVREKNRLLSIQVGRVSSDSKTTRFSNKQKKKRSLLQLNCDYTSIILHQYPTIILTSYNTKYSRETFKYHRYNTIPMYDTPRNVVSVLTVYLIWFSLSWVCPSPRRLNRVIITE